MLSRSIWRAPIRRCQRVKRVIIYYNERIAYENTLAEALDAMFGEGASSGYEQISPPSDTPSDPEAPPVDNSTLGLSELFG